MGRLPSDTDTCRHPDIISPHRGGEPVASATARKGSPPLANLFGGNIDTALPPTWAI